MSDERIDFDLFVHVPIDQLGHVRAAARAAKGGALPDAATACGVSLSTFKRRLSRGERRFRELTSGHPTLRSWWQEGDAL